MTRSTFLLLASFLWKEAYAVVASESASSPNVYTFRGGTSSSKGRDHGTRGLACFRELLDEQVMSQHLMDVVGPQATYTDDHLAAAIYIAYGEQGIDQVCQVVDQNSPKRHRNLRQDQQQQQQQQQPQQQHRSVQEQKCTISSVQAVYPTDVTGSEYAAYEKERSLDGLLPDGASYASRTDPRKIIQQVQVVLDDSLEAEYRGMICEGYFSAVTDVVSIVDLVVVKQGAILDGINGLSCGLAQGMARATQSKMYGIMADALKHDLLVNDAEQQATYQNTAAATGAMCTLAAKVQSLADDITTVKDQQVEPARSSNSTGRSTNSTHRFI